MSPIASPYHHSLSSVQKWGGVPDDYFDLHFWFDQSKELHGDFRHRALRHHTQGIFELERVFGTTLTLSTCARCGKLPWEIEHEAPTDDGDGLLWHQFVAKVIPTRWVGEQHVTEDCGCIPTFSDWVRHIEPEPWMSRAKPLSRIMERQTRDEVERHSVS